MKSLGENFRMVVHHPDVLDLLESYLLGKNVMEIINLYEIVI